MVFVLLMLFVLSYLDTGFGLFWRNCSFWRNYRLIFVFNFANKYKILPNICYFCQHGGLCIYLFMYLKNDLRPLHYDSGNTGDF